MANTPYDEYLSDPEMFYDSIVVAIQDNWDEVDDLCPYAPDASELNKEQWVSEFNNLTRDERLDVCSAVAEIEEKYYGLESDDDTA